MCQPPNVSERKKYRWKTDRKMSHREMRTAVWRASGPPPYFFAVCFFKVATAGRILTAAATASACSASIHAPPLSHLTHTAAAADIWEDCKCQLKTCEKQHPRLFWNNKIWLIQFQTFALAGLKKRPKNGHQNKQTKQRLSTINAHQYISPVHVEGLFESDSKQMTWLF